MPIALEEEEGGGGWGPSSGLLKGECEASGRLGLIEHEITGRVARRVRVMARGLVAVLDYCARDWGEFGLSRA